MTSQFAKFCLLTGLIVISGCSHKFQFEELNINLKMCTLEDAIQYEKLIGSTLVEDTLFYTKQDGNFKENRVYRRLKSGIKLPLYVRYNSWDHYNRNTLYLIEYFWGPYQGLANDSVYVKDQLFKYATVNPYNYERLSEEFSSLVYQLNNHYGRVLKDRWDTMYIEQQGDFSWDLYEEGNFDRITGFSQGRELPYPYDNYCMDKSFRTMNFISIERYNQNANIIRTAQREMATLKRAEPNSYAFIQFEYLPGYNDDTLQAEFKRKTFYNTTNTK